MNTQIILLVIVALLGIPVGFFLKKTAKEEMNPGKKWFRIISIASLAVFALSPILTSGDDLKLLLTASSFIFFVSSVPLMKKH